MEVVWSDLALASFADILHYIQSFFGQKIADKAAVGIISFVDSLGTSPYLGKRLDHLASYGEIRCIFYKQNHIYYQIIAERIEIVIVWDGRQDPKRLQNLVISFLTK